VSYFYDTMRNNLTFRGHILKVQYVMESYIFLIFSFIPVKISLLRKTIFLSINLMQCYKWMKIKMESRQGG
jgi:hypothetical protein